MEPSPFDGDDPFPMERDQFLLVFSARRRLITFSRRSDSKFSVPPSAYLVAVRRRDALA